MGFGSDGVIKNWDLGMVGMGEGFKLFVGKVFGFLGLRFRVLGVGITTVYRKEKCQFL